MAKGLNNARQARRRKYWLVKKVKEQARRNARVTVNRMTRHCEYQKDWNCKRMANAAK